MEDLVTFFIFLVVVGVSLLNSVAQAKKRREEELEEALQDEDGEERLETHSPPPPPEQRSASPLPTKGTGWDDLRKQLEQMLGEGEVTQETKPIAPEPKERAQPKPAPAQKAEPVRRPVPSPAQAQRQPPPAPPKREPVQPVRTRAQPAMASVQRAERKPPPRKPVPVKKQPARRRAEPVRTRPGVAVAAPRHVRRRGGGFPNLHPDPLANAIVLTEILRPYSRRPGPGRRPPYGAG